MTDARCLPCFPRRRAGRLYYGQSRINNLEDKRRRDRAIQTPSTQGSRSSPPPPIHKMPKVTWQDMPDWLFQLVSQQAAHRANAGSGCPSIDSSGAAHLPSALCASAGSEASPYTFVQHGEQYVR